MKNLKNIVKKHKENIVTRTFADDHFSKLDSTTEIKNEESLSKDNCLSDAEIKIELRKLKQPIIFFNESFDDRKLR
jgi:hypothetical protein